TASGTVDLAWNGTPEKSRAVIALDAVPSPQPAPDAIPVTAVVRADYDLATAAMQLQQLSVATRATRLNAAGNLGRANSRIDLSLNTTDLREFQPALAAMGSGPIPVSLNGRASFTGTVAGTTKQPRLVGHLEIRDFDSVVTPAAKAALKNASAKTTASSGKPIRLHWDSLVADV